MIYGTGSSSGMHVSGHGYQEDLKLMLTLMKPKYLIPIHGEYRMLYHHSLLAESVGIEQGNTFIMNNGDVVDITNSLARQTRKVPTGNTFIDGLGVGDVGDIVLRDRKQLSEDGMLVIVLTMSKREAKLVHDPDIISRGFVYHRDSEKLLRDVNSLIIKTVNDLKKEDKHQWNIIKQSIKNRLANIYLLKLKESQ